MAWRRVALCLVTLALLLSLVPMAWAVPAWQNAKIEPELFHRLAAGGRVDYVVHLADQADLAPAYSMNWDERGEFVYQALSQVAASSQAQARSFLKERRLAYESFFAGNELYVHGGDLSSAYALAAMPQVASLRAPRLAYLDPLLSAPIATPPQATIDWGIVDARADDFWAAFGMQGQGIVVANIDTGVQWDHPALVGQFRCPGNPTDPACWRDPANICGGGAMCDNHGHGTHTMGTMVAADDPSLPYIAGMAPAARWIACKGCETASCSEMALDACADWILAPGGNPANRPNVVNNSWSATGGEPFYLAQVQAWRAAGIFPAFAAGNEGSACGTLGSPGDYQESFGTAAHGENRVVSSFSSRGPSAFGHDPYTKPNLSAPGEAICSTIPADDWHCYYGTSVASPHTAGAVALLWSCNPALVGQVDQTFQILQDSADPPPAGDCGAPPDGRGNYSYGYGYLNAYNAGLSWCGEIGHLAGMVHHAGTPIPGAQVVSTGPGGILDDLADPSGYYTMTMLAGRYTVTASAYGYLPRIVSDVAVLPNTVTTLDLDMAVAPEYVISGTLTEEGTGTPLAGLVKMVDTPLAPAPTNPATGFYSITVPAGVYTLRAEAPGHRREERRVVVDRDQAQGFVLHPLACILLVDDDQNYYSDVRSYYTSALDALGYRYDLWDVATQRSPDADDLMGYQAVIWFLGASTFDTLNQANEANVAAYLDAGGNFAMFGQDYIWDRLISPFGRNYLGIASFDNSALDTDPIGNAGNPIGDGLGPYSLVNPPGWPVLWTDNVSGVQASPFRWEGSGQNNSTNYEGTGFKTAFFAWPLEGIPIVADRADLLDAIVNWFGGCMRSGTLAGQVGHEYYGLPIEGATVTAMPRLSGNVDILATTDPNGFYTLTLAARTYNVTAQKDGFTTQTVAGVVVLPGGVTTQDLTLNSPVIVASPADLHAYVDPGGQFTLTLGISDVGALDLSFSIREATRTVPLGSRSVEVYWVSEVPTASVVPVGTGLGVDVVFSALAPYDVPGDYTATLVIQHNDPLAGNVVIPVTMTVAACIPVHDPGFTWSPSMPGPGEAVTLTATVAGDLPVDVAWDFGDGAIGSGIVLTHSYALAGVYTVTMTATNCGGQYSVSLVQAITVASGCVPVHDAGFSWSPITPTVGDTVQFAATASGDEPITYTWDLGDGAAVAGLVVTHVYTSAGAYTVVMTATNCDGRHVEVAVYDVDITCDGMDAVGLEWAPANPMAGEMVTLTATVAGGTAPFTYSWDLGDGVAATGMVVTHLYTLAGVYTVTLTVTDASGALGRSAPIVVVEVPAVYRVYLPIVFRGP